MRNSKVSFTVSLPAVSGHAGKVYIARRRDSRNRMDTDGYRLETIDGQQTDSLTQQYEFMQIVSNGTY